MGILGYVLDHAEVRGIVKRLLDAVPSGSYLAITDPTHGEKMDPAEARLVFTDRFSWSGTLAALGRLLLRRASHRSRVRSPTSDSDPMCARPARGNMWA